MARMATANRIGPPSGKTVVHRSCPLMDVLSPDNIAPVRGSKLARSAVRAGLDRRRLALATTVVRLAGGGGSGSAAATRRIGLLAYTGASIALGIGILAWATATITLWPSIDPGLDGTAVAGPNGGLLLWLLFGLFGSVRVLRTPDGGTMTFHMPFIGAAMVLGGPTAGAWVAFLSSIERRELESQPWYGILANHSVLAIAAVMGGLATQAVATLLGVDSVHGAGGAALVAALAGSIVLAAVSTAMGMCTIILRDESLALRAFLGGLSGEIGRVTALEIAAVIVLALAYVEIGWWTPLLIGAFILAVWNNDPMPPDDELTGLRSYRTFWRLMERGLGQMRRGLLDGGTLMYMDLDKFGPLNKLHGHDVGDEVLREVGHRLSAQARRADDLAGRLKVGDELGLFLPGLRNPETAMRRAAEVAAAICSPILTSVGPLSVGVSVGVRVVESRGTLESGVALLRQADQAMRLAKLAGGGVHLFDPTEPTPFETHGGNP